MPEAFDYELNDYLRQIDIADKRADDVAEDLKNQFKNISTTEFDLVANGSYIDTYSDIYEAIFAAIQYDDGEMYFTLTDNVQ